MSLASAAALVVVVCMNVSSSSHKRHCMVVSNVSTRQEPSNVKHAMRTSHAQLIAKVTGQSGTNAQMNAVLMDHNPVTGSLLWRQNMAVCSAVIWTRCNSAPATQSQFLAQWMQSAHGLSTVSVQPLAMTHRIQCPSSRPVNGWRFLQPCMVVWNARTPLLSTSVQRPCATNRIAQSHVKVLGVSTPHAMLRFLLDVMVSTSAVVAPRARRTT